MSELFSRIQGDLNVSRKAQDKPRTLVLGTILADLKNRQLEVQRDLTDADTLEVLQRGIKRRRESIEMYAKAGRDDLASKERIEVEALQGYLPAQVGDDEIRAAVRAAISGGAANMGAVMGKVAPQFKGRADGSRINAIVREELAKQG
jgi:uncharacterized protein